MQRLWRGKGHGWRRQGSPGCDRCRWLPRGRPRWPRGSTCWRTTTAVRCSCGAWRRGAGRRATRRRGGLVPLDRPEPRGAERQAARRGELDEAEPRIPPGASLPLAGALIVLPALAATGLLGCVEATYTKARAAFYGVRSLVLTVVF